METPDHMNPLYAQSGCLHSEDDTPKCFDCGCEIYQSNMTDCPWTCIDCETITKIMDKMRPRYQSRSILHEFFHVVMPKIIGDYTNPNYDVMLIKKS